MRNNTRRLQFATIPVAIAALLWLGLPATHLGKAPLPFGSPEVNVAELFAAKCAACHGKDGRGLPNWRAKGQPDFTDSNFQKSRTEAQLAESIRNGKGKFMPTWKDKLASEQINALVGQVRAFGKKK
jgi:mono/diheme cytochrome c family protein